MSQSLISNRLKFNKKGTQRDFILNAERRLNLTPVEFSKKLKIGPRTLRDWKNERIDMSYVAAQAISKKAKVSIPRDHVVIDWRAHLQKAGKIGGKNKFLKYGNVGGDEKNRKEKWQEWWNKIGQYKKSTKKFIATIKVKIPKKSVDLAEFVGIMLGDGGISKYHATVTLSNTEMDYISYVGKLIYKLFGVMPKIYKSNFREAVNVVVQRKQLVDFCQGIGLVVGNKVKQQIDIPAWIKENEAFSRACIRGLVDTDGCFFVHKYNVNGKKYSYLKIAFTSTSLPLVFSVREILINLGFNVRISKNRKDVRIEDSAYVYKYIKEIGSHNNKHIQKIRRVAPNGKAAVC